MDADLVMFGYRLATLLFVVALLLAVLRKGR
jgi:hypothetical protein